MAERTLTLPPTSSVHRHADKLIIGGLLVLSLVPAAGGMVRMTQLAVGVEVTEANARFFDSPLPVVAHLLSVVPYSVLGAFQFAPGFRRRHRRWHRRIGRVLAPLALVVAVSGLWMTVFYDLPEADGEVFGPLGIVRLVVGAAMIWSVLAALAAIRRRDWTTHGAWMLRAYALAMGAGTQVFTHLPYIALFGFPSEGPRAFLMTAGWAINIVVAEWIIRRP